MKLPDNYVLGVGIVKPTGKGGFGQKMLEKMGWKDGEGLGKHKTGIAEAIELKIKDNKDGVGRKTTQDWNVPFWENAYESGLKNFGKGSSGSSTSSSDSSSESDSGNSNACKKRKSKFNMDGTVATGCHSELEIFNFLSKGRAGRWGGREAKLARIRRQEQAMADEARKKLGLEAAHVEENSVAHGIDAGPRKSKKQKSMDVVGGDDGTPGVVKSKKKKSTKELADLREGRTGKGKLGKKKKKDKEASGRSMGGVKKGRGVDSTGKKSGKKKKRLREEVMSTKSGCGGTTRKKRKKGSRKPANPDMVHGEDAADLASSAELKRAKDKSKEKKHTRKVVEVELAKRVELPDKTPLTGWWGAKRFISAGFAGEVQEVIPTDRLERQTFDEDDQVKVYMFAHNAKRKGFGGLGC